MCRGREAPGNSTKSSGNSGRRLTQKLQCFPASAGEFLDCTPPIIGIVEFANPAGDLTGTGKAVRIAGSFTTLAVKKLYRKGRKGAAKLAKEAES